MVWEPFLAAEIKNTDGFLNAYPKCHERSAVGRVITSSLGLCVKEISAENQSESEANDPNLRQSQKIITSTSFSHSLKSIPTCRYHL